MANEKIHEYIDTATLLDVIKKQVVIDCDVEEIGGWLSKQLNVQTLFEAVEFLKVYGSFHDETSQVIASINTPQAIQYNVTDISQNVEIIEDVDLLPTIITVLSDGIFNVQFSAQIVRISGGSDEQVSIWFRKNGVDIPNSNTHINVNSNNQKMVASWNIFVDCLQDDEIQIMWSSTSENIELFYEAENPIVPHPSTPSVILTVNKL